MRLFKFFTVVSFLSLGFVLTLFADDDTVEWLSNYKDAIQEAKRTHKPIFLEYRCEA